VPKLADKNFELLMGDPHHPALHFKKRDRVWFVLGQLFLCLLLVVGRADAQPCGMGRLHLYAYDSMGRPVENLTVEILKPESREPFHECRMDYCPARQTGSGSQTEFIFPTVVGGGSGADVTIKYSAPGYLTYEETGAYLLGCEGWHAAVLMRNFEDVPKGAEAPSLVGIVRELFYNKVGDYRIGMTPGQPLPSVMVVAEKDGKRFSTTTDREGRYKFDALVGGDYVVYPLLPKTLEAYDTNGLALNGVRDSVPVNTGNKPYPGARDKPPRGHAKGLQGDGLAVSVGNTEVPARVDFLALPSGRISGLVEGVYEAEPGINYSRYLELLRVNPLTKEVEAGPVRTGYSEPLVSSGEKMNHARLASYQLPPPRQDFRFNFYQVPAGKYVIKLSVRASLNSPWFYFYYPGMESVEQAKIIDFSDGSALTDLSFKLPPLITRQVYGEVTMPDGKLVEARVRIVDTAQPWGRETPAAGGRFVFPIFRGRRFNLYAYLDGERDGRLVRYTGQALNQWDGPLRLQSYEGDFGPIKIVLDRVEDR